jgi:hypothetical protein
VISAVLNPSEAVIVNTVLVATGGIKVGLPVELGNIEVGVGPGASPVAVAILLEGPKLDELV